MRDKLIELLNSFLGGCEIRDITPPYGVENLADYLIANGVTVDAEPVKHGHWVSRAVHKFNSKGKLIKYCDMYSCSECGVDRPLVHYNYCPNCGAKMEGIKDNDTC